jgi:membrane-associated phospholipid phosphatase
MWAGEIAAAWRLFLLNWIVLGVLGAALALALLLTDFTLEPINFSIGIGFVAVYAAFTCYNAVARNRRDPQIVFVLGGTAQIVLITLLMAPFTYIAAAADFPMQDAALLAIDKTFGLDWLAYVKYVNARPLLASWLDFGYTMIKWPLFIIPVALAAARDYRRLEECILAFALALVVTTAISTAVPAIGVFQQLGVAVTDFPNLSPEAYLGQLQDLPPVRDGSYRVLDLGDLSGIITFPSFHAASAVLYGWALWGAKWMRPIAIVANVAMLAATPITGGHYFVDVVAGMAVGALAIIVAKAISARLEPADTQSVPAEL